MKMYPNYGREASASLHKSCFEHSDFELTQRMLKPHIFYVHTLPFLCKKHECLLLALEHASALLEGYVQCTA